MQERRDRLRVPWAPLVWSGVLWLAAGLVGHSVRAQTPTPPAADAPAARETSGTALATTEVPAHYFSPLKLSGAVNPDGTSADLVADIEVHVTRDAGWYDVPLRMPQAVVTGLTYTGPREPIPREASEGQEDGLHWLFFGRGVHRLKLALRVPLRRTPSGLNLQLTLPNVPRLFPTQCELKLPPGAQPLEPSKDHILQVQPEGGGGTRLIATIQGTRVDLAWRMIAERPGTITRASTTMTLLRQDDRLLLQATQDLATDGRIESCTIRLPHGFRLEHVGGASYVSHTPRPNEPEWLDVQVRAGDRPELQLEWTFATEFPAAGGTVVVDGLEVRGAVRQIGTVAVASVQGYRIIRQRSAAEEGVAREDVMRTRSAVPQVDLTSAYAFMRQPFELTLNVQELRLVLESRPRAVVTTAEEGIRLDVDYRLRVDAGVAKALTLRWPDWVAQGWVLREELPGVQIVDATDAASDLPGEVRRLELATPRDGEFSLRLSFALAAPPGPFELTLPLIDADRQLPAWLLLRGRDTVEPRLADATRLPALTDSAADEWLRSEGFARDRETAYLWETPQTPVIGQSVLRRLEVTSDTRVVLTPAAAGRWRVDQTVDCDVRWGRLTELVFTAPATLTALGGNAALAGISARDAAGRELTRRVTDGRLQLALPEPADGRTRVQLSYLLPDSESRSAIQVPIFLLTAAPYASTIVEFQSAGTLAVRALDPEWQLVSTAANPVYVSEEPVDHFAAGIDLTVSEAPQHYSISAAFARVSYALLGRSSILVDYHVQAAPERLVFELPGDVEGLTVKWEGTPLASPQAAGPASASVEPRGGAARRFELILPIDAVGKRGHLNLSYQRGRTSGVGALSMLGVDLPVLPEGVDIAESYLELELPGDHCLFTYPRGMSPQFRWEPGLIFQRLATSEYLNWREGFFSPETDPASSEMASTYPFRTLGGLPGRLEYRVISVWMLILFGSGLTLALAFLLWSTPATRNVLTVLVIGFLVALAGLFAGEVVELLLQPVLLGLLAAAVAISTQSSSESSRMPTWESPSTRSTPRQPPSDEEPLDKGVGTTHVRPVEMKESGSH